MLEPIEEAELSDGIARGGHVLGAIVARAVDEHVIYLRTTWGCGRGYRILRTWCGHSGNRAFKNLQSAWMFIRQRFAGRVMIYPVADPELAQFVGIAPVDARTIGFRHDVHPGVAERPADRQPLTWRAT